jgi:site-specific recombinase XerD
MPKRLPKILERDEMNAIKRAFHLQYISGLRNRCIVEVMHRAGLRVSEVIHLRPSHVKLTQQKIEVWDGKGGKDRVLPFDSELVEWLRRWKQDRPASDWFFCNITKNRTNRPLTTQYLNQMVKRIAKRYSRYLSDYYERIKARRGGGKAIVALARKFLGIIFQTLKNKWVFEDFSNFVLAG